MSSVTEESTGDLSSAPAESTEEGIEREIGHDEFDPVGTLVLIGIYLAIVVFMWVFIYFVEFLGRGPTVI